ncbi:MAG: hypothetical protein ACJ8R9_11325 [Steroidobacteraceae bacterium]
MSTLGLAWGAADRMDCRWPSPPLQEWVRAHWAILFSHPQDFAPHDLEVDRWLVIMRQAFSGRRVRPLALPASTAESDRGWVAMVNGDSNTVIFGERPARELLVEIQARALCERITSPAHRFAMIIDGSLSARRTFVYDAPFDLPSPLTFLGWIDALRAKGGPGPITRTAHTDRTLSRPQSPTE